MEYRVLTAEQAARDWSGSEKGHALRPQPWTEGRFVLTERALNSPFYAAHHGFLGTLPKVEISEEEIRTALEAAAAAKSAPTKSR